MWLFWGKLDTEYFEGVVVEEILDIVMAVGLVEVDESELIYLYFVDLGTEILELLFVQIIMAKV